MFAIELEQLEQLEQKVVHLNTRKYVYNWWVWKVSVAQAGWSE